MNIALEAEIVERAHLSAQRCRVLVAELGEVLRRGAAWNTLLEEAAYPNPFHGPAVVTAHAKSGLAGPDLRFVVVEQAGALSAVLPFRPRGSRIGLQQCHAVWTHPLVSINGTPLVHRDRADQTVEAMLDGMASVRGGALWRFPLLAMANAPGQTLLRAARRRGWPVEIISSFERAVLDRRLNYATYASCQLNGRRRKGLRRRARRLSEIGKLDLQSSTGPGELPQAVEAFLELEARGWKGRRGTALASSPVTTELARTLFEASAGPVKGRADLLRLDGQPIAISLALVCQGRAFMLKTAYDESLRAHAPGLLLEDEIIRSVHETRFADRLDSASLAGCVLEDFFPDRETIADVVIATDSNVTSGSLAALVAHERLRLAALAQAKRLYWRLVDLRESW